jgi:hypothetical protein
VLAETGDIGTRDLPHPRDVCYTFPFRARDKSGVNARYCALCYCTVCKIKASECKEWGDGKMIKGHHCQGMTLHR